MDTQYLYNKYESFKNFTPTLITSILILVISYYIANYYKNYFLYKSSTDNDIIYHQIAWMLYYLIIFIGVIFTITTLGFNIASIVTILGTMGLAIGLAMQNSLQNIISGIFISIYKLFKIDDYIKIVSIGSLNPTTGKVIDFNLGYTTILELKTNIKTIIPNTIVYGNLLTNYGINTPI
jgi:small conductance mechanosensitive channel